MFGLMKNLIKENPPPGDAATLADLHTGCVVGFGFMPQKSVSGKRVPVTEVNSYLFDTDNFISYRLTNDGMDVNLIVADEENPTGTYLAMSQRIEPRLFASMFPAMQPQYWFALHDGETVEAKPPVLGAQQGWLTSSYTLLVSMSGRYLEGDWRMRKPTDRGRFSRPFEYVLLVDEDNEYAIEAEKYEDGTLNVFATIYRPATDIGEIKRAPKSVTYGSVESIPHVSLAEPSKPTLVESAEEAIAAEPVNAVPQESKSEMASVEPGKTAAVESKFETALAEAFNISQTDTTSQTAVLETIKPASVETIAEPAPVEAAKPAEEKAIPEAPVADIRKLGETSTLLSIVLPEVKPAPVFSSPFAVSVKAPVFTGEVKAEVPEVIETPKPEATRTDIAKPEEPKAEEFKAEIPEIEEPQPESSKVDEPKVEAPPALAEAKVELSIVSAPVMPVHSKFGRIQPANADAQGFSAANTLACDLPLASRLIDEALRNQMLLSELVRKVIDLPARVQDQVLIPFALDSAEVAELARRYNLPASDADAVKRQIIEELKRFVGEKV